MNPSSISVICFRTCGGRGILAASLQTPNVTSSRNSSDDVKFLTRTDLTSLKRGRGGRSSFSGVVATIFGATGYIGNYVCNMLGKTGTQMIIPYRCENYDVRHIKVSGDLGQVLFQKYEQLTEDIIRRSIKHSDVVINLIGREYETRNFNFTRVNVEIPERIARVCKEMGIKKFVHLSALNSDRAHEGYLKNGGSGFLSSKGEGERIVRERFPEAIILRPSDMYGGEDSFLRPLAWGARRLYYHSIALPYGGKGIWKKPVAVENVARGIVNSLQIPSALGNTYDAGGPRKYEFCDLIDWMYNILRRDHKKYGYFRYDMKWNPFIGLAAKINERISMSNPLDMFTADKLEREAISDVSTDLPNLTDLGVDLTLMENKLEFELELLKSYGYYRPEPGEFPRPIPPTYIEAV